MDVHLGQELLDELGSSLENLETQQGALLQYLKDKGVVTDEQLAPYLNQAGNASSVRWRAARLRLERILSNAEQAEQKATKEQPKSQDGSAQTPSEESDKAGTSKKVSSKTQEEKETEEAKKKPGDEAKSSEEHSENLESSSAESEEEAKPAPKAREEGAA